MSTPKKKANDTRPEGETPRSSPTVVDSILGLLNGIYRFLASLKLAVISLASLAAVLGYATFFEKWYGTAAVQEWIYRGKPFAILLAFLAANILCAALIRYPWKKRQIGFLVTHAGLLMVIGGSWWSLMTADEGNVGALEGETKAELVRSDYPFVRVRELDPAQPGEALHEWELPFRPGSFAWGPGKPKEQTFFASLNPLAWFDKTDKNRPVDVLTKPKDPFQFFVKSHMPASTTAVVHEADPSGSPMLELRPTLKAPNMETPSDVFRFASDRWFTADNRLYRVVKSQGPAQFAFQFVDKPELVEQFLNPPAESGNDGVGQFRYDDKNGKRRTFDLVLDDQKDKVVTLPDSDITVKLLDIVGFPAAEAGLGESLGAATIPIVEFEVRKGDGPAVKHFGLASLPMFPNVIPTANPEPGAAPKKAIADLTYYLPPNLDPKSTGLFGMIEILGTPEGNLYYRVFGRPEAGSGKTRGVVRSKGPLKQGEPIVAFGGKAGGSIPMTIAFTAENYFPKGIEREVAEPITVPSNMLAEAIAASEVEMTVPDPDKPEKSESKTFFIRRSLQPLAQSWQTVNIGKKLFQVSYDVDRKPLGFEVKLNDFDVGFDPGTEQASRFVSKVFLTDRSAGIVDQPHTISMNEPMTHKGFTFYQSRYNRIKDPVTGRDTGDFQSIFQVGIDPGRQLKYLGGLLVVLGAFLQFYMRAGLFTDAAKRERAKASPSTTSNGSGGSDQASNGHAAGNEAAAVEEHEAL